jgi:hypothetical protein
MAVKRGISVISTKEYYVEISQIFKDLGKFFKFNTFGTVMVV